MSRALPGPSPHRRPGEGVSRTPTREPAPDRIRGRGPVPARRG